MKAIKFETEQNRVILIEVADEILQAEGGQGRGQVAGVVEDRLRQLKDVGEAIADVCRSLQDRIENALDKSKPSELTLEFGIKLAGETGIPLVSKGTAEGTFQVTAKWEFSKEEDHV